MIIMKYLMNHFFALTFLVRILLSPTYKNKLQHTWLQGSYLAFFALAIALYGKQVNFSVENITITSSNGSTTSRDAVTHL